MNTLANRKDTDEMLQSEEFHKRLKYLLRCKSEMHFNYEIVTYDPLIRTYDIKSDRKFHQYTKGI